MPNVDDLRQSRFLKRGDVTPPQLVTIHSYEEINVAMENSKPDIQWVLFFKELEKPLVLKPTNGELIRQITGSDKDAENEFAEWIGKKIILYWEPTVMFGTKITGGIRCRAPENQPLPIQKEDDIPF